MSAHVISVVNQKGGVGKTTTAVNISAAFASMGKRVLIIDFDPQSNASSGIGVDIKDKQQHSIYKALCDETTMADIIIKTKITNLHIIPCTVDLAGVEIDLASEKDREFYLKKCLKSITQDYDFVFIDCPPSLGILTLNALVASEVIFIPLQCEFFALEGLSHLLDTAERVKGNFNPHLAINGIVLTMYDRRNKLTEAVERDVRGCLGDMVYKTVIPRNVKLSEAPSHGVPTILYDPTCSGSIAYKNLASEMLDRMGL